MAPYGACRMCGHKTQFKVPETQLRANDPEGPCPPATVLVEQGEYLCPQCWMRPMVSATEDI